MRQKATQVDFMNCWPSQILGNYLWSRKFCCIQLLEVLPFSIDWGISAITV